MCRQAFDPRNCQTDEKIENLLRTKTSQCEGCKKQVQFYFFSVSLIKHANSFLLTFILSCCSSFFHAVFHSSLLSYILSCCLSLFLAVFHYFLMSFILSCCLSLFLAVFHYFLRSFIISCCSSFFHAVFQWALLGCEDQVCLF